jgi:hypothetical protein
MKNEQLLNPVAQTQERASVKPVLIKKCTVLRGAAWYEK